MRQNIDKNIRFRLELRAIAQRMAPNVRVRVRVYKFCCWLKTPISRPLTFAASRCRGVDDDDDAHVFTLKTASVYKTDSFISQECQANKFPHSYAKQTVCMYVCVKC